MPSLKLISFLSFALAPYSSAHFVVNTPAPLGLSSNINNEDIAPCGGFTPSSTENTTDFHVGGDAISVSTLHAQAGFAYRGMLGMSLTSPNWTILIPTLEEYGLNNFCEPGIMVPPSWAGSSGLLQIIQDAEDGVHYQCMAVNFIAGVGTPNSATCSNSSGVSATFRADDTLSEAEGLAVSSSVSSASQATSPTSSPPASTSATKSAALPSTQLRTITGGFLLAGILLVFLAT